MKDKPLGKTQGGKEIDSDLLDALTEKAEIGFDTEEILRRRGGRPPMGSSAASVESVRLDPELQLALDRQAVTEGRTNSELIRNALRDYLQLH